MARQRIEVELEEHSGQWIVTDFRRMSADRTVLFRGSRDDAFDYATGLADDRRARAERGE